MYLSTLCDDAIHGKKSLHAAINTIFSVATSETPENSSYDKSEDGEVKPNLLWSALYIQELFMVCFLFLLPSICFLTGFCLFKKSVIPFFFFSLFFFGINDRSKLTD